jgi:flagellar assembly protein FliH
MSSFEPLFGKNGHARLAPLAVAKVSRADVWMPKQVGREMPRVRSIFETGHDGHESSEEALRESAAAAAAAARQAEIDAAFARGMLQGREQGEQAERTRLRGAVTAAESALDDVRAGEARWLANIEENISAIAIAVAQQIVTREVTTSSEIVIEIATRAVQEFGLDQALIIKMNPGDLESIQSAERLASGEMNDATKGREVRWAGDARIEPGGCVVEGRERIVDGRVDTGLERLYRRLAHANA